MKLSELEFQIEWLKTYAFSNKLTLKFQIANTPVSKEYFIDINETTYLGFTIEEALRINKGVQELCLTRHLSLTFREDVPKDLNFFDFYLSKFGFNINITIASYNQPSKHGGIIVHFLQQID
jgi:hypothetical protein